MPAMKDLAGRFVLICLAVTLAVSGCAYDPTAGSEPIDNPLARRLAWFSFIEGGDIRDSCRPGAADRYRLVYNGVYDEQVRIYEIGRGEPRLMRHRALPPADLAQGWSLAEPLGPWRGESAERRLSPREYADLMDRFSAGGMFAPPPVGLRLPSRGFYWTAAACRDGVYRFTAWLHPSPRFAALTFPEALARLDITDVPVNPPRRLGPSLADENPSPEFTIEVGRNGLRGFRPLLSLAPPNVAAQNNRFDFWLHNSIMVMLHCSIASPPRADAPNEEGIRRMNTAKTKSPATKQIEDAVSIGQETVQKVVQIGTEAAYDKAASVAKDQVEAAVKAGNAAFRGYEDMVQFNRDNFEAFIKAGNVLAQGFNDLNRRFLGLAQESVEQSLAAGRALAGAKDLMEVVDIQSGLARNQFDRLVAESNKASEVTAKFAEQAMAPLNERLALAMDRIVKAA